MILFSCHVLKCNAWADFLDFLIPGIVKQYIVPGRATSGAEVCYRVMFNWHVIRFEKKKKFHPHAPNRLSLMMVRQQHIQWWRRKRYYRLGLLRLIYADPPEPRSSLGSTLGCARSRRLEGYRIAATERILPVKSIM